MLSGVITSSQGTGGAIEGGLMTVTTGFSLASPDATGVAPANFTTVDVSLAGVGSLSAKAGKGSLKVSGKGSQLPVAVAGPKGVEVFTPSFGLSAQDSKDLNGGALTYQWALIPTVGQSVNLAGRHHSEALCHHQRQRFRVRNLHVPVDRDECLGPIEHRHRYCCLRQRAVDNS